MRSTDASSSLPSAQAQNSAAASGLRPRALAQNDQPPRAVTYSPPSGIGSLKTPYLYLGAYALKLDTCQMPCCHMAALPLLKAVMTSPAAGSVRGAMPCRTASCQNCSACRLALESKATLPSLSRTSPPPCHMKGYQVKFW
jgi:hypothetical protein